MQRDERGRPVATLETNNDITERRADAGGSARGAGAISRTSTRVMLLGEMTASIAHEVNQPIAAVVTSAGAGLRWLAAEPPDLEEARQTLGRIVKDGNRASEVIGRIRALVKKAPPREDQVDINETVLEIVALTRSEMQRNGVSLQTRLASDLPLVLGDRVQLQQVILNLIINAIEAMRGFGEGRRAVAGQLSSNDGSNGVLVAVRDSGPGLDPDGSRPPVRRVLYDQARWHRHGAGDQPFDHRGPRRAAVGYAERYPMAPSFSSGCPVKGRRPRRSRWLVDSARWSG